MLEYILTILGIVYIISICVMIYAYATAPLMPDDYEW